MRLQNAESRNVLSSPACVSVRSSVLSVSDYIIKEKTVLLQKKDSEGFGFVLRGAKAQTPIEEFTPTPAFPALQYLESVDEGGVAWRAGLRMGDFLIEVNGQNVVKVGHRQVVNMIRQGGNSLMVKVVMVTRNPDMEEGTRKKIPQQSKRLSTPAIALRSKSMTSELEEMGKSLAQAPPGRRREGAERRPTPLLHTSNESRVRKSATAHLLTNQESTEESSFVVLNIFRVFFNSHFASPMTLFLSPTASITITCKLQIR
uniref:PDZ domain-containing protein n=1 Tax=Salarias fasciatus TaxID=181472 RepID=A0A672G1I4_SALFA